MQTKLCGRSLTLQTFDKLPLGFSIKILLPKRFYSSTSHTHAHKQKRPGIYKIKLKNLLSYLCGLLHEVVVVVVVVMVKVVVVAILTIDVGLSDEQKNKSI